MENSSIHKLVQNRIRISENLCRLSILLKVSSDSDPPIVRIAISDTGVGSCLVEFKDLNYTQNHIYGNKWDGVLYITTTSICDEDIYHYHLNSKENKAKRLIRLPSTPKNGEKFSGTEVSLCANETIDDLVAGITCFLKKLIILKVPKVAVELVVEHGPRSRCESHFLENADQRSNIDRLVSGFEDYVLKHHNNLDKECQSCFSNRDDLKVGSGVACSKETLRGSGLIIEAVVIVTELPEQSSPSCLRICSAKTEVVYFQDFTPSSIFQSSLNTLASIDWKSYGLSLKTEVLIEDGKTMLEWENLPPLTHIDIAIHCYNRKIKISQAQQKMHFDKKLVKKAITLAMDDLKEKYAGTFLSSHALKIQSYAPDLARSIAGLILSSNDMEFQGECISLLGLSSEEIDKQTVEDDIRKKIISVIQMNDKKPQKGRDSAPFLFGDETIQEQELQDEEDGGEEEFDILDL